MSTRRAPRLDARKRELVNQASDVSRQCRNTSLSDRAEMQKVLFPTYCHHVVDRKKKLTQTAFFLETVPKFSSSVLDVVSLNFCNIIRSVLHHVEQIMHGRRLHAQTLKSQCETHLSLADILSNAHEEVRGII